MTLNDARKILGLGPDEDPSPHLEEFVAARERIAEMVRTAPNTVLADRYQEGLVEFDRALAAVREHAQAVMTTDASPDSPEGQAEQVPEKPEPTAVLAEAPAAPPAPEAILPDSAPEPPAKTEVLEPETQDTTVPPEPEPEPEPAVAGRVEAERSSFGFALTLVLLLGAAAGGWLYFRHEENRMLQMQARISLLERLGSEYVENRRWQEASAAFAEIEDLMPGSELAKLGRRSIEAGMSEEQTQFIGYWTGQSIAELEAGRLTEAETALHRVLERYPNDKEALAIQGRINSAKASQSRDLALADSRKLLGERRWSEAAVLLRKLVETSPGDAEAKALLGDASAAMEKEAADRAKAQDLLEKAVARDRGTFDQEALDWLREAAALAPGHPEITARLEKMASYTRTLRVPGDFATPAEALAAARDRDRIVLGETTWKGPLVVNAAIELQGAGSAKTFIECPATEGSALSIGPGAKGARITGIAFRHESFHAEGADRFSAVLVRGGGASFSDCHFSGASGHGLAVIEGGEALVARCRFSENGWNGAAAIGAGSVIEVRESESRENFENGFESWNGASMTLVNNRCEGNSRNGIHADTGASPVVIEGNQLIGNREFGIVLGSASGGRVTGNTTRGNLLGGIVVRGAASNVAVTGNQSILNQGPGLVLEKGLSADSYQSNKVEKNQPREILTDADLAQP